MERARRLCLIAGLAMGASAPAVGQVLYDNGPLVTIPAGPCLPLGSMASEVQAGNTVFGFGGSALAGERLADDFGVVNPPGWSITGFDFFAYQPSSGTSPSPITSVNVQIWSGRPGDIGSNVLAGDMTTNRLVSSVFAGIYRYPNATCSTARLLFRNTVSLPVVLPPGNYWIDWQIGGSALLAGPFVPATTYTGFRTPQPPRAAGNARRFDGVMWVDATDPDVGGLPQDFPFAVKGTVLGLPVGACCLTDGTCVAANAAGCTAQGGTYLGDGTVCASANCPPPGACCLPDFSCQLMTSAQCGTAGGVFRGNGVACAVANCPAPATGACCLLDGTCALNTGAACAAAAGLYRGDNSACGASACPATYIVTPVPAIAIPDGGATNGTPGATATATINVPATGIIADLDVDFVITHTWQGDLAIRLQGPGGQTIDLVGRPGVAPPKYMPGTTNTFGFPNDNYGTATLPFVSDDEAVTPYDNVTGFPGPPPASATPMDNVGGRYKPVQPLATFDGTQMQGTWQLTVNDYAAGDTGAIVRFGLHFTMAVACYANCDHSTAVPFLNVNDFICFQAAFAAGDPYANCDGSTAPPVLNVNDFICFQAAFAAGCSAP